MDNMAPPNKLKANPTRIIFLIFLSFARNFLCPKRKKKLKQHRHNIEISQKDKLSKVSG